MTARAVWGVVCFVVILASARGFSGAVVGWLAWWLGDAILQAWEG